MDPKTERSTVSSSNGKVGYDVFGNVRLYVILNAVKRASVWNDNQTPLKVGNWWKKWIWLILILKGEEM